MMAPLPSSATASSSVKQLHEWLPFPVMGMADISAATNRPQLPSLPPFPADNSIAPSATSMPAMPAQTSRFSFASRSNESATVASTITTPQTFHPLTDFEDTRDYSDDDLAAALTPMLEKSMQQTLHQAGGGMETHWEPWLRTTIRRALAEQRTLQEPEIEPGFFDYIGLHVKSFFGDRSYDELLFEKTKRVRVEEVFLLEKFQRVLLSYASSDLSRHAASDRVMRTVQHVADSLHDAEGTIRLQFSMPRGRKAEVCVGRKCVLIAIVLGDLQEAMRTDLEYTMRRLEDRYAPRFDDRDESLLLSMQPHLEDCLLIATPHAGG